MFRVSVCMPTYNGGRYIKEQLESILMQLGADDEIVISDDRSTDNTFDIIASLNDARIKVYTHEKIENPYEGPYKNIYYVYKNVENALKYASGDYIFLSDQDDIWLPDKVEKVMQAFDKGAWIIQHDNTLINNNHDILLKSYFSLMRPANTIYRTLIKCYVQGASMAFTKRVLEYSLPFPNNPISHDHWIAYNAYFRGHKMFLIKEPLLLYRRHGDNVSPSGEVSQNPLWFKISYRFRLLWALLTVKLSSK